MTTITVEWYNRGYRKCTTFSPYAADSRKENMTHCSTIATTARITDRSLPAGGGKVCFTMVDGVGVRQTTTRTTKLW